jgi:hypothetical protein
MKKKARANKNRLKTKLQKNKSKVIVGEDEFCPICMEWRAYDETTGKCKVCGHQIKKVGSHSRTITEEYDLKDFTVEHDEQQDTNEY